MFLKRTTVLSGNFAKKGALTSRSRAASENVQLVTPHNFGFGATKGTTQHETVKEEDPNTAAINGSGSGTDKATLATEER